MYVREIASELRWEWTSPTDSVPRFVQECIEYMFEREEDPKFPIETLWEGGGDCEDKAILAAALLKALGYDVVFVTYPYYFTGHAMLGVAVPLSKGCYVSYRGKKYYLLDVTNKGYRLGQLPQEYQGKLAFVCSAQGIVSTTPKCKDKESSLSLLPEPSPKPPSFPPKPKPSPKEKCHPSYPDFCIPPPPPDLDCKDIPYRNFRVRWDVPYLFSSFVDDSFTHGSVVLWPSLCTLTGLPQTCSP